MDPWKKFAEWYKTEWYRRRHWIVRGTLDLIINGAILIWLIFLSMYLFALLVGYLLGGSLAILSGDNILDTLSETLLSILRVFWGVFDPRVTFEMLGEDWKWIRPMISLGVWILIAGLAVERVVDKLKKKRLQEESQS